MVKSVGARWKAELRDLDGLFAVGGSTSEPPEALPCPPCLHTAPPERVEGNASEFRAREG